MSEFATISTPNDPYAADDVSPLASVYALAFELEADIGLLNGS